MSTPQTFRHKHSLEMTTDTRVSAYDKTATFLVAAVVVLGFLVFVLFMIWLSLFTGGPTPKPAIAITEMAGNDDRPEGVADDWQEPGVEDLAPKRSVQTKRHQSLDRDHARSRRRSRVHKP